MEEDVADARSKRRCTRRGNQASGQPSAVHYVGYVEDDETPEMIMAKFEALDRIQASSHSPGEEGKAGNVNTVGLEILAAVEERSRDGCLTDAQLLEVFKQTSIFNVKTALADNEALLSIDDLLCQYADRYGSDEEVSDDEDWIQTFWSATENGKDAVKRSSTEPRQRMPGGTTGARPSSQSRHRLVTSYNPFSQALVRRKVRVCDKNEVVTMRIPAAPLPLSWGRTVRPYSPGSSVDGQEKRCPLVSYDSWLKCKAAAATYEAALINPGWVESGDDGAGLKRFATLPLPDLVPSGMVFMFIPKQYIQSVCQQMVSWGFMYIENLTWVYLSPNHTVSREESPFFASSHLTLYMFRWADRGREMELRHQRNPDVLFDCCLPIAGSPCHAVPQAVYDTIETLLPGAKDRFLELWAAQGSARPGWTQAAFALDGVCT
uniref:Uncharacterized protein n=1 Tax=Auxenochlorella protothecoides TaxID=3075 RepID=A0A1D2AEX0_AUXPR